MLVLDLFGVIAAFVAGWSYFEFMKGSWPLAAPLVAFLAIIVIFTIESLLEKDAWRRTGILLLETIALVAPFYASDLRFLSAAAAAAFIFLWIGHLQCRSELDHGTTIRFFKSTHGVAAKVVTALFIAGIVLYLPRVDSGAVFIGESEFTVIFNWAAGIAGNIYPTLSLTGSFADFSASVAREGMVGNATFDAMTPKDQVAVLASSTVQVEESLSKFVGGMPLASSTMSDVAYHSIQTALQGWRTRFSVWFTIGWGVSAFVILRSIGALAVWVGQLLSMVVYELLLASGVIRIMEEPQTKEVLEFQ